MLQLLVVSADESRLEQISGAAQAANEAVQVQTHPDAQAASDALTSRERDEDALVLADLTGGGSVADFIDMKAIEETRRVPVVCLIDEDDTETVVQAYDNHINACLSVADDGHDLEQVVTHTLDFFGKKVRLSGASGRSPEARP